MEQARTNTPVSLWFILISMLVLLALVLTDPRGPGYCDLLIEFFVQVIQFS